MGSGEERLTKPDPALFRRALDRLKARPEQVVYVGNDLADDIVPARQIGLHTIHFDPRGTVATADAHELPALRARLFPLLGLEGIVTEWRSAQR